MVSRTTPRRVARTLRDAGFRSPGRRRPAGFHVDWRDDGLVVIVTYLGNANIDARCGMVTDYRKALNSDGWSVSQVGDYAVVY